MKKKDRKRLIDKQIEGGREKERERKRESKRKK